MVETVGPEMVRLPLQRRPLRDTKTISGQFQASPPVNQEPTANTGLLRARHQSTNRLLCGNCARTRRCDLLMLGKTLHEGPARIRADALEGPRGTLGGRISQGPQ